jgi:hypothetical protein
MAKLPTAARYSLKWAKEFSAEIAKGRTAKEVVAEWRPLGNSPAYATIWLWRAKYGEFAKLMTDAYEAKIMIWTDELEEISLAKTPQFNSPAEYASYRDDRRTRIDALKFSIAKLAPVFNKNFEKSSKVDVQGSSAPQIIVTSYATPSVKDIKAIKVVKEDE